MHLLGEFTFFPTISPIVDFSTPYFSDSILSVGLGNIYDSLISLILSSRDNSKRPRLEGGSGILVLVILIANLKT